ncbi:MAG TPA: ABC transporter ATP-binding protein [Pyrinomonadaceae bacterium]|nr:ABC transporter ATP-binding protein [Pyrinomonadaceae bacterium]
MEPVIKVEGLSKKYQIGAHRASYSTLRDALAQWARAAMQSGNSSPAAETIWALRDVSFEVSPGEVIGIIGRNGAGKSTLLKILSRITEPTSGRVQLYGRIASLLEVGTGFHPELTGRENIFLNGAILGMARAEIRRKFDEIVAFAEIEKFIDTPVKFYSSGMHVRLAFAVAAHLEPEILVLDEVLAVGDTAFQQKCLGKMRDVTRQGRTVLLVSHSMSTVSRLCKKTLWLDDGRLRETGPSDEVIQSYLSARGNALASYTRNGTEAPADSRVFITSGRILNHENQVAAVLDAQQPFSIEIEYEVKKTTLVWVGFSISTRDGADIMAATDGDVDIYASNPREPGAYKSTCHFPEGLFNTGQWVLSLFAARTTGGNVEILDYCEYALSFGVENPSGVGSYMPKSRVGVISPRLDWELEPAARPASS